MSESNMPSDGPPPTPANQPRRFALIRKWLKRGLRTFVALVLGYGALIVIGLIPVNRDFVETEDGIEVFVLSGAFHSDIILPVRTDIIDWQNQFEPGQFSIDTSGATHVGFGWGDRNFYLHTPTWSDLKVSTAGKALLIPSETVMHVAFLNTPVGNPEIRRVKISPDQYQKLVNFIVESFQPAQGGFQHIVGISYGQADAFFVGDGSYHCFRTCNCWVGDALKSAGVKTGWFTPLPKTVYLYFP